MQPMGFMRGKAGVSVVGVGAFQHLFQVRSSPIYFSLMERTEKQLHWHRLLLFEVVGRRRKKQQIFSCSAAAAAHIALYPECESVGPPNREHGERDRAAVCERERV